jgi:hypothetical protein
MSSFQYRELLAKSEVFEKQTATTVEESENRTRQEYKRVYHVQVLPRFACEWQYRILLKSQADRILARDTEQLFSYNDMGRYIWQLEAELTNERLGRSEIDTRGR